MLALESKSMMITRKFSEEFKPAKHLFAWEMLMLDDPKAGIDWGDYSYHKNLTCVNHPRARFTTKNPWVRSLFCIKGMNGGDFMYDEECSCPFSALRLIKCQ